MNEIDTIKSEARQLLEEVNSPFDRATGKYNTGSAHLFESISESSFRDRLKQLRQKVTSLQLTSASLVHRF